MFINLAEKILNEVFARIPQDKPEAAIADRIKLVAHRGAHNKSLNVIENTLESFERARQMGCWGLELDVHATKDGVIVVNHDPTLDRLWNKPVAIADLDFAALRALEPRIPALNEVIASYGKTMHLFIEMKAPFQAEEALFADLASLTPCEDYHLLSLEEPLFAELKHFPKTCLLLVPVHNNVRKFCRLSLDKGYAGVLGNYWLLKNAFLDKLLQSNQKVGVGFINSRNSLYRELHRPIPWIFTDNVDCIRACLNEL